MIKQDIRKSAFYSIVGAYTVQFATTAVNFLTKIILARLIIPEDWGFFAQCIFVLQVVSVFWDMGLRAHQMREKERSYGNVLALQLITGSICFLLLEIFAPLLITYRPKFTTVVPALRGPGNHSVQQLQYNGRDHY